MNRVFIFNFFFNEEISEVWNYLFPNLSMTILNATDEFEIIFRRSENDLCINSSEKYLLFCI